MVGFVDDDDEGPRPVGVGQAHVETETVDSADVPLPAAALDDHRRRTLEART